MQIPAGSRKAQEIAPFLFKKYFKSADGFAAAMAAERKTVYAMIKGLGNNGKPFIYTSGTGMPGDTEDIY